MKLNKWIQISVLGLVVALSAAGCKSSPPSVMKFDDKNKQAAVVGDPGSAPIAKPSDDVTGKDANGIPPNDRTSHNGWKEDVDALKAYTVHFDYDSTVIKESEKPKLEAIAAQLKGSTSAAIRIEGHCDERGTEEYNRSLGEKRALALREELARLGVDASRQDTISFGEDRPVVRGHDDSSYRQNRRGEFVQLTPPQ
jgi:peptidoglycan-associated lipoprotein